MDIIPKVEQNFVDSAYDTNANRAFPDVRDGLKPGQRAIIWEMYKRGYTSNKPHVKSAKVSGGVAALWWPHGTSAIYETFVHMSQDFTCNVPTVDFHGANGNVILGGDGYAADRYTNVRLAEITERYMLPGVEKGCVKMQPNFSEDEEWPKVLPSVFPNLLVNGSQGIGVSTAQVWLPHNLSETVNLIARYLDTGELDMSYAPDFPTGGVIVNADELPTINETGAGKVILRARYRVDSRKVTFYEMPYQVYIEDTLNEIRDEIDKGDITGVEDAYNSSDKNGIGLVVVAQTVAGVESVITQLFQHTHLQSQYNANQNAIVSKTPVRLTLRQVVDEYVKFNVECIRRQYEHDLTKLRERLHIIEGLLRAIADIDEVVKVIRTSDDPKATLVGMGYSERQADAILAMRLSKLSHLESSALESEQAEKRAKEAECAEIVDSEERQHGVLKEKLAQMAKEFGGPRRTELANVDLAKAKAARAKAAKAPEDVIIEPVYVNGSIAYIKRVPLGQYRSHGAPHFKMKSNEFVNLVTNWGRMFRICASDIKECGTSDKGQPYATLGLEVGNNATVESFVMALPADIDEVRPYLLFAFEDGHCRKQDKGTLAGHMRNRRGIDVATGMVGVVECSDDDVIRLETANGMGICFSAGDIAARKSGEGRICIKPDVESGDYVRSVRVVTGDERWAGEVRKPGGRGSRFRESPVA